MTLFARRKKGLDETHERTMTLLRGGGRVNAVGELSHQAALSALCGGKCRQGVNDRVQAVLIPEPTNPHDPNAIRVYAGREGEGVAHVGYLSRADALKYGPVLLAQSPDGGACTGYIVGGWDRGDGDTGKFGIWLDLAPPGSILD